uniref:Ovule protein n=1 Tax=Ditylenchus dipsaci TaxID=166011 RepID=A0A915EHY4_9BILA
MMLKSSKSICWMLLHEETNRIIQRSSFDQKLQWRRHNSLRLCCQYFLQHGLCQCNRMCLEIPSGDKVISIHQCLKNTSVKSY